MKLTFDLPPTGTSPSMAVDIRELVIAGWTGRDRRAIEHHIDELAALGVPRPSAVPLFYRVASHQLTQGDEIQVVGEATSGEAEPFVFAHGGRFYVTIASDHTDRRLESDSVALSKQICAKPVARSAWLLSDVAAHWDELIIRSFVREGGRRVLYQEGTLSALQPVEDLLQQYFGAGRLPPDGFAMTCGTVAAIGGIRPADRFQMELVDPRLDRCVGHAYRVDSLPIIA